MLNKITTILSTINIKLLLKVMGLSALFVLSSMSTNAQDSSQQVRVPNNILSGEALGDFAQYRPESGDLMVRSKIFYTSTDGDYSAGIWESKTGSMEITDFPATEVMYIVEGGLMLNAPGKNPIAYRAGEGVVVPKGWNGTFTVPQGGLKMVFSLYRSENQPMTESNEVILLDRDTIEGKRFSEFRPFDPDVSDIIARDHEFHRTADDKFGIDVWEAQPGQVAFADLGYDEMIYVLEGNMTFVNRDGNAQIYGAGKAVVLPSGWSGTGVVSTNGARVLLFWYRHAN